MPQTTVDARISQEDHLKILSRQEIAKLLDSSQSGLYKTFRRCALAVLNCGIEMDDIALIESLYKDFDIRIIPTIRGVKLELVNAPSRAFVEGKLIRGISEHLFAVVRDILYANEEIFEGNRFDLTSGESITDAVFHLLRNADALVIDGQLKTVVCWGGHSISQNEYIYTKKTGHELGLRGLNICTGCGPGAMKGPMKGATIGHAKQRNTRGRYLGITEPGIIETESPNPIVNELVILPDIEKRLEAFARVGHAFVVFPGGVGTMEEILYLLGILLQPENREIPFPLIFTGPQNSRDYFETIDRFIGDTLGSEAQALYQIIIDDPVRVSTAVLAGIEAVRAYRKKTGDAFYYNWRLSIPLSLQTPFIPTHENVRKDIRIASELPLNQLIVNLRKLFSAIVAGNVKEDAVHAIKVHGKFEIHGETAILSKIDELLEIFIQQGRMKLPGKKYEPCYKILPFSSQEKAGRD